MFLEHLRFRMWDWVVATLVLVISVWWVAPHQLPVVMYKLALVALAACLTYWIDHSLFKRTSDRTPGEAEGSSTARDFHSSMCMLRRALIFLGCVLGLSLGV